MNHCCVFARRAKYYQSFVYCENSPIPLHLTQVTITDPQNPSNTTDTETSYDALGRVSTSTDPRGFVTQYDYDVTDTFGLTGIPGVVMQDHVVYPAGGGETWSYYDLLGRTVANVDPSGGVTQTVYNALSEVVQTIDPLNFATQYVYDKLGRQVEVLYPDGGTVSTQYAYDLINGGYTETVIDQMNGQTVTRYDKAGQLLKQTNALGYFKTFSYDQRGRMVSATDENGIVRESVYDLAGNLIQSIDGMTYYEEYAYDAGNRLIQKSDKNGNTTTYNHDIMGRLLQEVDALGPCDYMHNMIIFIDFIQSQ